MDDNEIPECAVCLQSCNHPAQLPCGHVFCFLCVKGVAIQNKCCAMCRREIPPDYLDHPVLLPSESVSVQPQQTSSTIAACARPLQSDSHEVSQWYYEGRNGWWRYDERSNSELETAYNAGATDCQLLLAGAVYHINFRTMLQYRRTDITRRRRVKRDIPAAPAKGIAGIKISPSSDIERVKILDDREDADPDLEDDDGSTRPGRSSVTDSQPEVEARLEPVIIPPPPQFDVVHSLGTLRLDATEVPDSSTE